ncbi:MAG: metalloregulator ArsR/SmtB family transcription factor [Myxococcota bacterium]
MPNLESAVGLLHLLGDPTRVRLMALLVRRELSVADLTSITGMPQSSVSTHLGKLREAGLLKDRKAGTSTLYAFSEGTAPEHARKVWSLLQAEVQDAVLEADRERCEALLKARERASWPEKVAGQMERHYSPGRTWEATARAFSGLLRLGDVLDVGSGDGTIAQLIGPRARSFTLLDQSRRMISAARERLASLPRVRVVVADMHEMPLPDAAYDQVLLFNVLTHARRPLDVLRETERVLRPGGSVALVTLHAHEHMDVTGAYHELNAGFTVPALKKLLTRAGLVVESCEVSTRERRPPYFEVINAFAHKDGSP